MQPWFLSFQELGSMFGHSPENILCLQYFPAPAYCPSAWALPRAASSIRSSVVPNPHPPPPPSRDSLCHVLPTRGTTYVLLTLPSLDGSTLNSLSAELWPKQRCTVWVRPGGPCLHRAQLALCLCLTEFTRITCDLVLVPGHRGYVVLLTTA